MKKNLFKLSALLMLVFFLSSCLTTEFKEYRFKLNKDGSGTGSIKYINIVSQDDEGTDVSFKDFGELVSDYMEGTKFEEENPGMKIIDKKLFEENGVLCGLVTFSYENIDSVGFLHFSDCKCAPILYNLGSYSETFSESNGVYLGETSSMQFIKWNGDISEFYFKTSVQSDLTECRSLLSMYNVWKSSK